MKCFSFGANEIPIGAKAKHKLADKYRCQWDKVVEVQMFRCDVGIIHETL